MDPEEITYERIAEQTSETSSVYPSHESCEDTGTDPLPHLTEQIRELNQVSLWDETVSALIVD